MTLDHPAFRVITEAEHLNGLVCFTYGFGYIGHSEAFVINPGTRKIFKLHDPTIGTGHVGYFFGYDESRNEHKVLRLFCDGELSSMVQIMILSLSNYSWRKVDATVDIGANHWFTIRAGVCVNSVVHWMLIYPSFEILAFDLKTEKFSIVKVPLDGMNSKRYFANKKSNYKHPYLMKINACIGVVCHDCFMDTNKVHIWILQDYESRVWLKETITFPKSWGSSDCPFPLDSINTEEIIFSLRKLSSNVISVPIYNMKRRYFKSVQFTLDHPFLRSPTVKFNHVRCYVESIVPLPKESIQQKKFFHKQMLSLKKFVGYQSK